MKASYTLRADFTVNSTIKIVSLTYALTGFLVFLLLIVRCSVSRPVILLGSIIVAMLLLNIPHLSFHNTIGSDGSEFVGWTQNLVTRQRLSADYSYYEYPGIFILGATLNSVSGIALNECVHIILILFSTIIVLALDTICPRRLLPIFVIFFIIISTPGLVFQYAPQTLGLVLALILVWRILRPSTEEGPTSRLITILIYSTIVVSHPLTPVFIISLLGSRFCLNPDRRNKSEIVLILLFSLLFMGYSMILAPSTYRMSSELYAGFASAITDPGSLFAYQSKIVEPVSNLVQAAARYTYFGFLGIVAFGVLLELRRPILRESRFRNTIILASLPFLIFMAAAGSLQARFIQRVFMVWSVGTLFSAARAVRVLGKFYIGLICISAIIGLGSALIYFQIEERNHLVHSESEMSAYHFLTDLDLLGKNIFVSKRTVGWMKSEMPLKNYYETASLSNFYKRQITLEQISSCDIIIYDHFLSCHPMDRAVSQLGVESLLADECFDRLVDTNLAMIYRR